MSVVTRASCGHVMAGGDERLVAKEVAREDEKVVGFGGLGLLRRVRLALVTARNVDGDCPEKKFFSVQLFAYFKCYFHNQSFLQTVFFCKKEID